MTPDVSTKGTTRDGRHRTELAASSAAPMSSATSPRVPSTGRSSASSPGRSSPSSPLTTSPRRCRGTASTTAHRRRPAGEPARLGQPGGVGIGRPGRHRRGLLPAPQPLPDHACRAGGARPRRGRARPGRRRARRLAGPARALPRHGGPLDSTPTAPNRTASPRPCARCSTRTARSPPRSPSSSRRSTSGRRGSTSTRTSSRSSPRCSSATSASGSRRCAAGPARSARCSRRWLPRVPVIVDRAADGLAARVAAAGLASVRVRRRARRAVEADWENLASWFLGRPGTPEPHPTLSRDAVDAVRTLTQNLTRLSRSASPGCRGGLTTCCSRSSFDRRRDSPSAFPEIAAAAFGLSPAATSARRLATTPTPSRPAHLGGTPRPPRCR